MNSKFYFNLVVLTLSISLQAQNSSAKITLQVDSAKTIINKEIYGHFAEHLGSCIYGGLWVGENSEIPNIKGYRKDVFEALKKLEIPVLRWPGGCFADEYHWMDGIGPKELRPKMVNNNWGGVVEDNSFGTHEFMNLCEMLGCEPYVSGNVGSGTVEELAKWVEYMTSEGDSPMANLRRKNGRDKAWKLKYLGVGNENWGCGGNMTPEYYSDLYRRYSTFCRNYDGNKLFKIACGASDNDYKWTNVLMSKINKWTAEAISLHYYTFPNGWNDKGAAIEFTGENYYKTLHSSIQIEDRIKNHVAIMDKYDKENTIALLVDEWGTWWDVEKGTNPGFLFQQNTMRDAFVAALSLNIFNKYSERVKMANIAQVVNVLQAMILTQGPKMILTPTYHVFDMYKVHKDATYLPMELTCDSIKIDEKKTIASISASASKDKNGLIHISLANIDATKDKIVEINLGNVKSKLVKAKILTAPTLNSHNTFERPNTVFPVEFKGVSIIKNIVKVKMPSKSIVMIELN